MTFEPTANGQRLCGNVPITDDHLRNEPNEVFSVTITNVSDPQVTIGDNRESCVTIIDIDSMLALPREITLPSNACLCAFFPKLQFSEWINMSIGNHMNLSAIIINTILVPELAWEEREVVIPEGDNRMVCFRSDIGTAQPYDVTVSVQGKGADPVEGKF